MVKRALQTVAWDEPAQLGWAKSQSERGRQGEKWKKPCS